MLYLLLNEVSFVHFSSTSEQTSNWNPIRTNIQHCPRVVISSATSGGTATAKKLSIKRMTPPFLDLIGHGQSAGVTVSQSGASASC